MENISEQCWVRIESIRARIKSVGRAGDEGEFASIDAEMIELRDFVSTAFRPSGDKQP